MLSFTTVTLSFVTSSENEWKTRYETQVELNGQLEKQTIFMQERLEGLRGNPVGEFIAWSEILNDNIYLASYSK